MCLKAGAIFSGWEGQRSCISALIRDKWASSYEILNTKFLTNSPLFSLWEAAAVCGLNLGELEKSLWGPEEWSCSLWRQKLSLEIQNLRVLFNSVLLNLPLNLRYDTQRKKGVPFPHFILIPPGYVFLYLVLRVLFFSFGSKTTWAHLLLGIVMGILLV